MNKRILSTLSILGIGLQLLAQNVTIPDANFKTILLNTPGININGDTEIQLSEAANYSGLIYCINSSITDLTGIEAFPLITELDCRGNNIANLNTTNNPNLIEINCGSNNISSLDLSNNSALEVLLCYSNNLNTIDISTNLALTELSCHSNNLSSLDVSNNTALTILAFGLNSISSIDLSANLSLEKLNFNQCNLTSIDLSNNTALTDLSFQINNVTALDVSTNTALTNLSCDRNNISTLDLSNNPALTKLYCNNNNLSSLDISNNVDLETLDCNVNNINILDVSNNINLVNLAFDANNINTIDISNNLLLEYLSYRSNSIPSLDISNHTALRFLFCQSNNITSLDISNNTALEWVKCSSNNIPSLDVSNNIALNKLDCSLNNLEKLDLSQNTLLTQILCNSNSLYSLDVSNGNNSAITSSNFNATNNSDLSCIKVDDVANSTSNWTNIQSHMNFTTNSYPVVTAGIDQSVCEAELTTLSGSGASTYQWDNGVTNNTSFPAIAGTTTYTVTGTNVEGCKGRDTLVVTANALPTVEAGAAQSVCNGEQVTLNGSGASTYQWDNGITNNVAFTPTLGMTTYTVSTTNGNGCTGTDNVTITVNALPTIDAGTNQTVCEGETVILNGSGASTYQWNNGVTDNITFTPSLGVTNYTVTGTDANGCTNTDMVAVTTNSVPVVDAGANQAVCDGESVILAASGASTYLWNNAVMDNVSFIPPVGTTTYAVSGTNAAGCSGSDDVTVTVNELPNNSTSLSGNVIAADLTGANYQWLVCNNSNSEITGETGNSFTATSNGDYAVIVSLNGCSDTSSCVNVASVGINETVLFNQVSVYPNPTKEMVTVDLGNLREVSLFVYALTGEVVYQVTNINASVHQFSLNSASGLYVLSLVTNGETKQYKLIKE